MDVANKNGIGCIMVTQIKNIKIQGVERNGHSATRREEGKHR